MPTQTKQQTLEARAETIAAELEKIRQQQARRDQAEYARRVKHQEAVDAKTVADYDGQTLEAAVAKARQAVDQAVADSPLTRALTDYYMACSRRREMFDQYVGALARQGRDTSGAPHPQTAELDVVDLMDRSAQRAASDWRIQAEADFHTHRDNPDTKEQK